MRNPSRPCYTQRSETIAKRPGHKTGAYSFMFFLPDNCMASLTLLDREGIGYSRGRYVETAGIPGASILGLGA